MVTFEDELRVPPELIGDKKEDAIVKTLSQKYENKIIADTGVVMAVTNVSEVSGGAIEIEDPGIYYRAKFEAMIFVPKLYEVIEGNVVDITDFGVFVRFGPIDGLCHISQIVNDFISYDKKSGILSGKDSNKTLKIGDTVRARVIGISLEKKEVNKINLTMRQPGLGNTEWLRMEKEKKEKKAEMPAAKKK